MMTRWRSLFVTGAMLSALVLLGSTTALAQPPTAPKPTVNPVTGDPTRLLVTFSIPETFKGKTSTSEPALVDVDITGFEVAWAKGSSVGANVLDTSGNVGRGTGSTSSQVYDITNLDAGTEYAVVVRLHHDPGFTRATPPTALTSPGPYGAHTAQRTEYAAATVPAKPTLTVTGYNSIRVRLTPNPAADGVTGYSLFSKAGSSVAISDADAKRMELGKDAIDVDLTDLMSATEYAVAVLATNPKGSTALSEVVKATTSAAPMPDRVPQPTLTNEGDGSLTLDWSAPAAGGTGITIVRYMVQFQEMGDASWLDWNPSPTMSEVTLTGLTNEKTYRVQVKAVNSVEGVSADWSIPASGTPMVEEPPPPPPVLGKPMPTLGMPTHDSVMVSWDAVEGADSYNVNWHVADSGVSQNAHLPTGTEYTITDLMPETMYYVSVCANRDPDFECSDDMSFTTGAMPGPELTAPMNVMVALGDGMLMVSWDAVESADSYKVSWTGGGVSSSATTMEMSYDIMGLANGTAYMVTVMAMAGDMEGPASAAVSGTPMPSEPVPALPLFGMLALGAGLVAAGRRRLHAQRLLK